MAEATQKTANYTAEMVDSMIEMYNEVGNDGLDDIADSLSKTVRSVRSKLVREGVYVASPKKTAAKQDGPSKKEILRDIKTEGFDVSGFEGATKSAPNSSDGCRCQLIMCHYLLGDTMLRAVPTLEVYKARGYRPLTGIYTSPVIFKVVGRMR